MEKELQARNMPYDDNAIALYFKEIKFANNDTISVRVVRQFKHIWDRLDDHIISLLNVSAVHFGKNSPLAHTSILEIMVNKTACPSDPALQSRAMRWLVAGTLIKQLRGNFLNGSNINKETMKDTVIRGLLLELRCVTYLTNRYVFTAEPNITYEPGYSPEEVMQTLFGTYEAFHKSYPAGPALSDTPGIFEASSPGTIPQLSQLEPLQRDLIDKVFQILNAAPDIKAAMHHAIGISGKDRRFPPPILELWDVASHPCYCGLIQCELIVGESNKNIRKPNFRISWDLFCFWFSS